MNITEAIAVVRRHLDAEDDTERWSDTNIKDSLAFALNKVQEDYLKSGGRKLDEIVEVTSNSNGLVDISSHDPLSIKGVSAIQGNRRWPLKSVEYEQMRHPFLQEQLVEVRLCPKLTLSATNTHPLVGNGATAKNTWESLEQLICVTAAQFCSVIDDEVRPSLQNLEMMLKDTVFKEVRVPGTFEFPRPDRWLSSMVAYIWIPESKKIQLCRRDY